MRPAIEDVRLPDPRVIYTADPYEARVRTQEFLGCSHQMTVLERENPFLARVQYRSLAGLGLMSSTYGTAVEIRCSPPIGKVAVNFLFGGTMFVDDGGQSFVADAGHAATFCFHEDLAMRWTPGLAQLMLTIDKARIERYLQALLHEPVDRPLRFHGPVDLASSGGQGIAAAVLTLRRALERCGKAGPPPVLAAEIEHSIMTTLLLSQRHNYTDAIFSAQPLPAPRVIRRVVELIESAPTTAFTVADLATHAGVSERSLHAAFRRQLGTSPMSYVRHRRLEQAHDELLQLDPTTGAAPHR